MHTHLEKTVGTIKFVERTSERSYIRYLNSVLKFKNDSKIRYLVLENPNGCSSGIGRHIGPTDTLLGPDCYSPDTIHYGISWVVLHEVSNDH